MVAGLRYTLHPTRGSRNAGGSWCGSVRVGHPEPDAEPYTSSVIPETHPALSNVSALASVPNLGSKFSGEAIQCNITVLEAPATVHFLGVSSSRSSTTFIVYTLRTSYPSISSIAGYCIGCVSPTAGNAEKMVVKSSHIENNNYNFQRPTMSYDNSV